MYKIAYGTDVHPDAAADGHAPVDTARASSLRDRIARLEHQLAPADLERLSTDLDAIEAKLVQHEAR
jgi:hypothetical protein